MTSLRFTDWSIGEGVLYNFVFTKWRHCVSQNCCNPFTTIHDGNFHRHSSCYLNMHDGNFRRIYYSHTRIPGSWHALRPGSEVLRAGSDIWSYSTSKIPLDYLVWCGMSEICLKLKVLAKIDFIVFFDFIRGQISQKYWGPIFPAPQPRFMPHSKWPPSKSHI